MEIKQEFYDLMKNVLDSDYPLFFESLNKPNEKAIIYYGNKNNEFEKCFNCKISHHPIIDNAYILEEKTSISKQICYALGKIYSQDASAMLPVFYFNINKGEVVLDLCASPGGKSAQIISKLNNSGLLISNEVTPNRCSALFENLSRIDNKNVIITSNTANQISSLYPNYFDKIVVDAPCSGEGMFRKNEQSIQNWCLSNVNSCAKRQLNILNDIAPSLKNGGQILYSTCTYNTIENEQVLINFLEQNADFELVKINYNEKYIEKGKKISDKYHTYYCGRCYPYKINGEGQFFAILQKRGDKETTQFELPNCNVTLKEKIKIMQSNAGLKDITSLNIIKRKDTFFILPTNYINFENLNILSCGVVLGKWEKNNFKINHNFYTKYAEFFNNIELTKEETLKYLHGETLEKNIENGNYIVTYNTFSLGGVKVVNGILKNLYPKVMRI